MVTSSSLHVDAPPDAVRRAQDLIDRWKRTAIIRPSDWYCDNLFCDGQPHDRWTTPHARAKQRPPDGEWFIHLIMAGRGFGKTVSGAQWLLHQARQNPGSEWAVVAPTWRDARLICAQGPSGLLRCARPGEIADYNKGSGDITLTNGAIIHLASGDQPDRLRGYNLWGAWVDEVASLRFEAAWHEGLIPSVRIGPSPRIVATTTPKLTRLLRDLVTRGRDEDDHSVVLTTGSTWENRDNLSERALAELEHRYGGSRLGRQELEGELLEDVEGALVAIDEIANARVWREKVPRLVRIVVGVDPAVTSGEDADATGIVVVGKGEDGDGYVLDDRSIQGVRPEAWAKRVIEAYHHHDADRVVAEVNNGGDLIKMTLEMIDRGVPVETVHATRGKRVRAEPVGVLYQQGRIHHAGIFPELESELTSWTPDMPNSPDRLDALVWACRALGLTAGGGSWLDIYTPLPKDEEPKEHKRSGWAHVYGGGEK